MPEGAAGAAVLAVPHAIRHQYMEGRAAGIFRLANGGAEATICPNGVGVVCPRIVGHQKLSGIVQRLPERGASIELNFSQPFEKVAFVALGEGSEIVVLAAAAVELAPVQILPGKAGGRGQVVKCQIGGSKRSK